MGKCRRCNGSGEGAGEDRYCTACGGDGDDGKDETETCTGGFDYSTGLPLE